MKLHAVAFLASALFFGGCAESVEEIQTTTDPGDSGAGGDTSTGRDSASADSGAPDTGTLEEDTGVVEEDTGTIDDSGEFPDFGGGDDGGGATDGGGSDGGGSGTSCTTDAECPGGCCDTTSSKCGTEVVPGFCFAG